MRACISLTLAGLCLVAVTLRADEQATRAANFRKVRNGIDKRLQSPVVPERAAALAELKDHPIQEAINLALPYWSRDPSPEVRLAAAETLYAFKDEPALRPVIHNLLKKEINEGNGILAATWLASASEEQQRELLEPLAKRADKQPACLQPFYPVADFLGTRKDADSAKVLTYLSYLRAFKSQFGYRRAVVAALCKVQHPDAVSRLLELLPDLDGEVRGDVLQHLTRLSGQDHGNDVAAWQTWWTKNKESFQFRDEPVRLGLGKNKDGLPTYYGIAIHAKKLIFVLDTSGSMKGQRIVSAKKELNKAINDLPATTSFNLVGFNSKLDVWYNKLQDAKSDVKTRAVRWVNQQDPDGATFTYDALQATLAQKPEAIYFLTDGQPTGGALVNPADILEAIKQRNKYQRTTIHVIGVNPGPEDGVFSKFLKELAAQNWGEYRRVD